MTTSSPLSLLLSTDASTPASSSSSSSTADAAALSSSSSSSSFVALDWTGSIQRQVHQTRGYTQQLLNAYQRCCQTSSTNHASQQQQQLVLITGPSGVGKTGLAMTLAHHMQQQQQQDDDEDDHNGSGGYGYFCRGKFDQPPSSSSSSSITTEPTTTAGIHHNEISNTNINSSSSHHSLAPFVTAITEVCRLVMQRQETVMVATAIQQELDATELQVLQESIPALRRILLATTTTTTTTTTATRPNLQRRSSTSFTTISSSHHGSRPTSAATSIITHPTTNTTYVEHWHGLKGPEAEKRYMYLFSKLIRAMSSLKDRPLIMLLDDVQWADPIALQLFQLLLTCCCRCSTTTTHSASSVHSNSHVPSAGGGGGFLLLATSRSGRDDEPSFMSALQQETLIGNSDTTVAVTNIHMEHLTLDEMNKLTADLLHLSINETLYLSTMAYQQTKGNLFFYIQYLSVLQGQGLLYIDDTTNQYTWNEHVITQSYCSTEETVLDFLTKKMLQLPDYDQIVLKTAACLGGTLYSSLLAEICFPSSQVVPALHRLQEQGLIQLDSDDVTSLGRCGAFRHDKIQEAAYSLVPPSDRTKKHLEIGLRLWIWLSPAERDLHMFTIVNQILKGLHLMDDDPVEKEDLAEFMLRAGEKATQLSSFSTAAAYFDVGIRLLSRRHWKHQYKLSLSLYNAAAEVEYYNGNLARVDALLTKLFKHAKSLDDTFRAHFTQIYSLGSRDDMKQALDKGLEVLKQLGENFPARPRKVQGELAWYRCQCLLRGKSDDDILNLPLMRDNRKLVAMRLLNTIWGFTIARDELGPFLLKRMVKNTLRHGLSPMCCVGFAGIGYYLGRRGRIEEGLRFGRLGLLVLEKFQAKEWHCRVIPTVLGGGCYRKNHFKDLMKPLHTAHRAGLVAGDVHFSMVCASLQCRVSFFASDPLPTVLKQLEEYRRLCEQYDQQSVGVMLCHQVQWCLNFMGRSVNPIVLTGEVMNEENAIKALEGKHPVSLAWILVMKHVLAVYFHELDKARKIATHLHKLNEALLLTGAVLPFVPYTHLFLECLAAASLSKSDRNQAKYAKKILDKIKSDRHVTCRNFENKIALLEAELAASRGDRELALSRYQQSIEVARRDGFVHEQALAYEKGGRALLDWQDTIKAREYLEASRSLYDQWGALAKVKQVDDQLHKISEVC